MKRLAAFAVFTFVLLSGPAALAQSSGGSGKPWIRLVIIIPASTAIGVGAAYLRRRMKSGS